MATLQRGTMSRRRRTGGSGGLTAEGSQTNTAISSALGNFQQQQDAANAANEARYTQGLGILNQGLDASRGFISQALGDSDTFGQGAYRRIGEAEQNNFGRALQSSINRGLYNTTIQDTLARGVASDAEKARQDVDEQVANRRSALRLQQSALEQQGTGRIADFIAARNDVGPDLGILSNLVQGAASDASDARRSGTVVSPSGLSGVSGPAASGGGGSSGGGSASYMGPGGGGGGFTTSNGGLYFQGSGLGGGSISSSIAPQTSPSYSPIMAGLGMPQGSVSITPSGSTPAATTPTAPASGGESFPPIEQEYAPELSGALTLDQWYANYGTYGMTPQEKQLGYSKYLASVKG